MKKTLFIFLCLLASIIMLSCATSTQGSTGAADAGSRNVASGVPQFVRDAVRSAPENTLVGIGTARMPTFNTSRVAAVQRARAEISRQMNTVVSDMQRDFMAASEVDHSAAIAFFETITVNLSRSEFSGASVVDEDYDERNNYWVVVMLTRSAAVAEINQAQAAAKLAVPAMASFDAERRMNDYFNPATRRDVGYLDTDPPSVP